MSMYKNIYLGVYIKAEYTETKGYKESLKCPNNHKKAINNAYCPVCGSKTEVERTVCTHSINFNDHMNNGDISWDYEGIFFSTNESIPQKYEYLIPNERNHGYGIDIEDINKIETDVNVNVEESIKLFKEKYADFILKITPLYGSIEIKYGIITWYS